MGEQEALFRIIDQQDPLFPSRLCDVLPSRPGGPGPPQCLYVRGKVDLLTTVCVAVVGTRHPTDAASSAAFHIGQAFAKAGITVVSGLAKGIDTQAHRGALAAGGNTIAVLGTPLCECYPKENAGLMETIAQRGLLVTEYQDRAFEPVRFIDRDRLQAALAHGVVPVQTRAAVKGARSKSGTLYTIDVARALGRLLIVPTPREDDYKRYPDLYAGGIHLLEQGLALRLSTATLPQIVARLQELSVCS